MLSQKKGKPALKQTLQSKQAEGKLTLMPRLNRHIVLPLRPRMLTSAVSDMPHLDIYKRLFFMTQGKREKRGERRKRVEGGERLNVRKDDMVLISPQ
ncbi:hypothetical protein J6590_072022 [Homalodisca vitripennis]|nr:hypothetical protein J6590_072022 [Homalodisca vitripennis]